MRKTWKNSINNKDTRLTTIALVRIIRALSFMAVCRDIAQSGSAPALGAGCREFESLYPDHFYFLKSWSYLIAPVAQLDRATAF